MSQVHDSIVLGALAVQADEVKKYFKPHMKELVESSWYPDRVGEVKKTADAGFLYPSPPKAAWQKKLENISSRHKFWTWCGLPPLSSVYLCGHYLKKVLRSIDAGDTVSAVKFSGVYSHVIADIIEPGHAVFDWIIDIFLPSSSVRPYGGEVYTNKECLRGPVNIMGYSPKLLGGSVRRAEMGMIAALINGSRYGAALSIPMEKALYAGKIKEARRLSSLAQNEAARQFADFIHTVFRLAGKNQEKNSLCPLDMCGYPFVSAEISCYCRFRPLVDIFLDPSSFDDAKKPQFILKKLPLALLSANGKIERVHGFSVMPGNIISHASVEYILVPGAYKTFSARVGFNPAFKKSLPFLSAVFTVSGDGRKLARSRPVRPGEPAVRIHANLGKTRFLTLSMRYSGNYSCREEDEFRNSTSAAHGVWAEPSLY